MLTLTIILVKFPLQKYFIYITGDFDSREFMSKRVNEKKAVQPCKVFPRKNLKNDEASVVVKKIFTIFDKNKDCRITGNEVQAVDEQDSLFPEHGRYMDSLDSLTPRDFKLTAKSTNLNDKDNEMKMSQSDFCDLLGGGFDPDIKISFRDAYAHLSKKKNRKHLKILKAYLEGISI